MSASSAAQRTTSLSFGFELEAVTVRPGGKKSFQKGIRELLEYVCSALENADFPATTREEQAPDSQTYRVVTDSSIIEFTTESDEELDCQKTDGFGFEIISPIYQDIHKLRHDLPRIIVAMNKAMVWKTNRTTAVHVHVGCGQDRTFSIDQVRRIAWLCVRFESAIKAKFPWTRRLRGRAIATLRYGPRLAHLELEEIYEAIMRKRNRSRIAAFVNCAKSCEDLDPDSDYAVRSYDASIESKYLWA
jgi:hypothetical protein